MALTRWQSDAAVPPPPPWPLPPLGTAIRRGIHGRCPICGRGALFQGFLRIVQVCGACGVPLGLARADDTPAYFTTLLIALIIVPLMLTVELLAGPPPWLMAAIFVPVSPSLAIGLLRPVKGATIGVIFALNMPTASADEA